MKEVQTVALWLVILLWVPSLPAHELQTVTLTLDEAIAGQVIATLKTPLARDGRPTAVVPQFDPQPGGACEALGEARVERQATVVVREWRMHCDGGLAGQRIRFVGLDPRTPEALITTRLADGSQHIAAVDRHDPVAVLSTKAQAGASLDLFSYLPIGIEHILLGPDHLLFVLGLMLVVAGAGRGTGTLLAALTAFTLAHSLTLAAATLGAWGLPPRPVEILIALSILFLALDLARAASSANPPATLTFRKPWLVAFVFGLLHGFGFAGALSEIGLPPEARGWALFLFNLGVECGQLLFVGAVLSVLALVRLRLRDRRPWPQTYKHGVATALGGVAAYWVLDRTLLWMTSLTTGA